MQVLLKARRVVAAIIVLVCASLLVLSLPEVSTAASIVPCGNDIKISGNAQSGYTYTGECTVCHLAVLAQNLLSWFIMIMVAVAALLFAYAGLQYIMAPGNPGAVSRGHKVFASALIGLIIILAAYLLIDTVMKTLLAGDAGDVNGYGPWNEILCDGGVSESYSVPPLKPVQLKTSETTYTTGGGF